MNDSSGRRRARRNQEDIKRRQMNMSMSFRIEERLGDDDDDWSLGSDHDVESGAIPRLKPSRADSVRLRRRLSVGASLSPPRSQKVLEREPSNRRISKTPPPNLRESMASMGVHQRRSIRRKKSADRASEKLRNSTGTMPEHTEDNSRVPRAKRRPTRRVTDNPMHNTQSSTSTSTTTSSRALEKEASFRRNKTLPENRSPSSSRPLGPQKQRSLKRGSMTTGSGMDHSAKSRSQRNLTPDPHLSRSQRRLDNHSARSPRRLSGDHQPFTHHHNTTTSSSRSPRRYSMDHHAHHHAAHPQPAGRRRLSRSPIRRPRAMVVENTNDKSELLARLGRTLGDHEPPKVRAPS